MRTPKICLVCNQPHKGRKHFCKDCKIILDRLAVLYDSVPTDEEKIKRAGRVHLCRRKASEKNGTANLHDKEAKVAANAEVRKDWKARQTERLLQRGDKRYRNRRTYAANRDLIEALASNFQGYVPDDDLPTTFVDCNIDFNFNNDQSQPTLGDIFVNIDPRFELFRHTPDDEPESAEPIEQIAGIVGLPDNATLFVYDDVDAYAQAIR